MTFSVTKEFRFEAAHRLIAPYSGKCSNLHGHSWVARVTCASDELNASNMVVDFTEFARLKEWIDAHLDHAVLVATEDSDLIAYLRDTGQRVYLVSSGNPTSEALAAEVFRAAQNAGRGRHEEVGPLPVVSVEVFETCTCSAKYAPEESS